MKFNKIKYWLSGKSSIIDFEIETWILPEKDVVLSSSRIAKIRLSKGEVSLNSINTAHKNY